VKESALYAKIVEWSEEDHCFVGGAPGLVFGGCNGPDEKAVVDKLCQIVDDIIGLYHQEGRTLPPPTSDRDLAHCLQQID
jgi:hypothetical protein